MEEREFTVLGRRDDVCDERRVNGFRWFLLTTGVKRQCYSKSR